MQQNGIQIQISAVINITLEQVQQILILRKFI